VYGASFFLMGLLALSRGRPYLAALGFAAAGASRLTYAPPALLAFLAYASCRPRSPGEPFLRGLRLPSALFLGVTAAAYWPSYRFLGRDMFRPTFAGRPAAFLSLDGLESPSAYLARFLYKNALFWGPWTLLAAASVLLWTLGRRLRPGPAGPPGPPADRGARPGGWLWAVGAGFLYFQAVFFRLPLEAAYLLPTLFLGLCLADRLARPRLVLALALAGQIAQAVVTVEILDREAAASPDGITALAGTPLRPHFRPGVLVEDLRRRASPEVRGWLRDFHDAMADDGIPDPPR
jgi:hypothetical protein